MSLDINRRSFLKTSAMVAGAAGLSSCNVLPSMGSQPRNMCGFVAPKLDTIRVGVIGLGNRGPGAVDRLAKIRDVEVVALCDIEESRVKRSQKILKKNGRKPAAEYFGTREIWKKLVDSDLDLVYLTTPWDCHSPMAVYAMENGKHTALEVPAVKTIEECWDIVNTSEKTGKHCVILENCCYDFFELQTLNMARQGVFGELTHAEGAYIHNLSELMQNEYYHDKWRFHENMERNGNIYGTHGLGPISQAMNVNRGNQLDYLTSISSQEAAFTAHARSKGKSRKQFANVKGYRGDMNTTTIKLKNGETMMIQHDVSTPRPYSRIHMMQGTQGMCQKWPMQGIALNSMHGGHRFVSDKEFRDLQNKYVHPLSKVMGDIARKVGGHGGMDFIMDYRMIYSLKNGLPMDMDVYDAAAWSAISPLSCESVANRGQSMDVPDFTRGNWKTNKPLEVVTVDPAKLPMFGGIKRGAKQLNVH